MSDELIRTCPDVFDNEIIPRWWAAKCAQNVIKTCKTKPPNYVTSKSEPGESSSSARGKSAVPSKPIEVGSSKSPPPFPANRSFASPARKPPLFPSLPAPRPFSQLSSDQSESSLQTVFPGRRGRCCTGAFALLD